MRKHLKVITIITAVVLTLIALSAGAVFADDTTPGNNACQSAYCQGDCDGSGNGVCTGDCDGNCQGNGINNSARFGNCYGQGSNASCTGDCDNSQNGFGRRGL